MYFVHSPNSTLAPPPIAAGKHSPKNFTHQSSSAMFTRLPVVARSVRGYATQPTGSDFLSSLMKRIDNLNVEIKKKKDAAPTPSLEPLKKAHHKAKVHKAQPASPAPGKSSASKTNRTQIASMDHPMKSNRFDFRNTEKSGNTERTDASGTGNRNNFKNRKLSGFIDARPRSNDSKPARQNRRNAATGSAKQTKSAEDTAETPAPQKQRRDGPGFKAKASGRRTNGARGDRTTSALPLKTIVALPLEPKITGDTFLYGKPAAMGIHLGSRVAAVSKRVLLESKYPYKLPLAIIQQLPPRRPDTNQFIATSDYSLDVDVLLLASKVKEVVKGETAVLETGKKLSAVQTEACDELMRNSTITVAQKQMIYDLSNGVKSVNDVLKTAAWKQ